MQKFASQHNKVSNDNSLKGTKEAGNGQSSRDGDGVFVAENDF